MWVLVAVTLGQGVMGIVQYQLGVPEVLVVLHVFGAVLLVTAAAGCCSPPAPGGRSGLLSERP